MTQVPLSDDATSELGAQEVLAYSPDLITVEFVNDVNMPVERILENWHEFIRLARDYNSDVEFILLTPTYMLREWMGNFDSAIAAMRRVAQDAGALHDTARNGT